MQQMVLSLDVVANGRAFLIDDTGVYIADEDSEKLLSANILEDDNPSFAALGRQILSQQEGSGSYTADGQTYLAWYRQIPDSGWYIVTTASEQELMADAHTLGITLSILCAVFAALLFSSFWPISGGASSGPSTPSRLPHRKSRTETCLWRSRATPNMNLGL